MNKPVSASRREAAPKRASGPVAPKIKAVIEPVNEAPVVVASPVVAAPVQDSTSEQAPTFHGLPLDNRILARLDRLGFTTPTPIQNRAIPVVLEGRDIIGIAQTGTGKTLAFGLPMLQRFLTSRYAGRCLILLPTRELALQVEEALLGVCREFNIKTAVLIGGAPIRAQQNLLRTNPDILIATPGRLIDHIQNGTVDLRAVDTLVLDEADRMLDMGFAPQIRQIVKATPTERQTMLFSATMPPEIARMAQDFLRDPERVEIERPGTSAAKVTQELYIVPQEEKVKLLIDVLGQYNGSVLVFARTRSRARRVAREVRNWNIPGAEIHADRTLSQRKAALEGFKSGKYRVLVATDIAARGIDVTGIELVVNFDLPDSEDDYIHRIGRTGRAGREGHAISFAAPDQWKDVRDIERLMQTEIPIAEQSQGEWSASAPKSKQGRPQRGQRQPREAVRTQAPQSQNTSAVAPAAEAARPEGARPDAARMEGTPRRVYRGSRSRRGAGRSPRQ